MFWGLIMEPNKRYTQTVEKAFHLSMASLDASTATNALVQVMLCYDNRNYLLCTLQKDSIWQVPLDLNFQEGTKIAFTCNGEGHVHLTGYLIPEDEDIDDFDEEDMEEEIPELVEINNKRKPEGKNDLKKVKKPKMEVEEDDDDESDDSDDDDENGTLGLEDDSDDDDDEEDEDEEEESDDDEDEEDEEEEEVEVPVQQSKKQKQKEKKNQQTQQSQQNQQQNQSQQNQSKKEKNKMVNGKDSKPEKEQGKQKKNKDDSKTEQQPQQQQQQPKKRKIEGGIQVEDLKQGQGAPAKSGKFVTVYYTGRLKNGKKFDQTTQGEGFKFRLGKGEVIKGWDLGIAGMKVGGKRRIVIPSNMAYGAKGSPPVIPPNSELTFEVELRAVH